MTTIHWATAEDQRLILCLHYDTNGIAHGDSEPHEHLTGYQAKVARRALAADKLLSPTHGGGYTITPAGRAKVESYRCT